jgi:hypothetical protein
MQHNEKEPFIKVVTQVLSYYRQPLSEFIFSVWWKACQPFTLEQVNKAFEAHLMDPDKGTFAPKIADMTRILGGTKTDRSLVAWGRVFEAMSSVGAYQSVDFGDDAIHAAITDLGGWQKVCRMPTEELSYLQHNFTKSYQAYLAAGVAPQPPLAGEVCDSHLLEARGLKQPKPVVVGGGKSLPRVDLMALSRSADALALEAK